MDKIEKLKELKSLLDSGVIDQKEFDQLKIEIIGGVVEKVAEKVSATELESIKIHNQIWAIKNLDVGTFRNGDVIYEAKSDAEWEAAGEQGRPAWCNYDNDPVNGKKYGKLYNWYAVNDPRGLAPKDWHIPSDAEWKELTDNLGGEKSAGTKMKSTKGWELDCTGTNTSGFTALPCGMRIIEGPFEEGGIKCFWWSSSILHETNAFCIYIEDNRTECWNGCYYDHKMGLSVRCLKDG